MTLPSSGALSYNSIRAEFGSPSSNVFLSLYVRGSQYTVPLPANLNIPTSATAAISVNNFYGAESDINLYAFGTGGSFNSGGKVPIQYYGWGDTTGNLPAATSTSIRIGNSSPGPDAAVTCSGFWHATAGPSAQSGNTFYMKFSLSAHNNGNLTSRSFVVRNLSGSSLGTLTTSSKSGTLSRRVGTNQPMPEGGGGDPGGWNKSEDDDNAANVGAPAGSCNITPSDLGQYFYLKAF